MKIKITSEAEKIADKDVSEYLEVGKDLIIFRNCQREPKSIKVNLYSAEEKADKSLFGVLTLISKPISSEKVEFSKSIELEHKEKFAKIWIESAQKYFILEVGRRYLFRNNQIMPLYRAHCPNKHPLFNQ